jgi:CHAT domain-containing protein
LLALLDQQPKARSLERETLQQQVEAELPKDGTAFATITALVGRAGAARRLGRNAAELDDLRRALDVADTRHHELEFPLSKTFEQALLRDTAWAELSDGNFARAIVLLERAAQIDTETGGWTHGQETFTVLAALALAHAGAGDVSAARAASTRARASIEEAEGIEPGSFHYGQNTYNPWRQIYAEAIEYALLEAEGKWPAAEVHLRRAICIYESKLGRLAAHFYSHGREVEWVHVERSHLVVNLLRQGRATEAEQLSRTALSFAIQQRGLNSKEVAIVLQRVVDVLMAQGRFAEAEQLALRLLAIHDELGSPKDSRLRGEARFSVAASLTMRSRWKGAAQQYQDVARDFHDNPETFTHRFSRDPTRLITLARTTPGPAITEEIVNARVNAIANKGKGHYDALELTAIEGMAHARSADRTKALSLLRESAPGLIAADRQLRRIENQGFDRRQRLSLILEAYVKELVNTGETSAHVEAFRIAGYAQAQSVQSAISRSAARQALNDPELAKLARNEQDAGFQIDATQNLLVSALSQPQQNQNRTLIKDLRLKVNSLQASQAALRNAVAQRFPEYSQLTDPEPSTLEEIRQLLRPNEALVSYLVAEDAVFIWAISRDAPLAFAVIDTTKIQLTQMVDRLRWALDPEGITTIGDIPPFDTKLAHELYKLLLAPVARGWKNAESVIVIPHGPIGYLPLSLLLTVPFDKPIQDSQLLFDRYRAMPWLARSHSVSVLPSVTSLRALRQATMNAVERQPFIGFADPVFANTSSNNGVSRGVRRQSSNTLAIRAPIATRSLNAASLEHLPPLPETADELRAIARSLGADPARDVLTGIAASEQAVKSASLVNFEVVAFATHGLVPGDLDGLVQPALAMSSPAMTHETGDGLLTMSEVLGLRLNADWVLLSACNTAAASGAGAEAISGLGRAFFFAGARALLVSNWAVHSEATKSLTTNLFALHAQEPSSTRAQALQSAMTFLIDEGSFKSPSSSSPLFSYAHPIFWAAFNIVGDGR